MTIYPSHLVRNVFIACLTIGFSQAAIHPCPAQMSVDVMNADGTGLRRLMCIPQFHWTSSPCWSPDGKQVVCDAFWSTGSGQFDAHVYIVPAVGGEAKDLGPGKRPVFSHDGKQVFCEVTTDLFVTGEIWVLNADGSGRELLFPGRIPRCSPDGSKILFTCEDGGTALNLYVYDVVEGTKTKLVSSVGPESAWSPDGEKICFTRREKGKLQLIVADAQANPESFKVVLDKNLVNSYINWSPGEKILATMKIDGLKKKVVVVDPTGQEEPHAINTREASHYDDSAWSPGGKMIGFVTNRQPTN